MLDGQTKEQDPQPTQSIRPISTASSNSSARMRPYISSGVSPQGQALTQLAQRMQGLLSVRGVSAFVSASTPFVPLTIGARRLEIGWPIIGPPSSMRSGSPFTPPQCFSTSAIGAPISASTFAGRSTPRPDTVKMREISGSPCRAARWMA